MQQVKIFSGSEDATADLEILINGWLRESGARIVHIFGNLAPQASVNRAEARPLTGADPGPQRRFAPSDILVVVVYETP